MGPRVNRPLWPIRGWYWANWPMRGRDVRRSEWHHVWNLYRSSIIIFMMCQNFYNSEKNIVLITRQSEYFIICYLHKSHFIMMQQVSGIYTETLYNYSESSQLWTPSWCESSKVIMRQWQPNEGVFPVLTWPWVTPGDWNRFLKTSSPRIPCIMQLLAPHHLLLASSDPIIIPGPLSTFWSIIYKWPVKLWSGGFWMMDLRAHLKSCREVASARHHWHHASKKLAGHTNDQNGKYYCQKVRISISQSCHI